MRRLPLFAALLGLAACQTTSQMLAAGDAAAIGNAQARARFEMNCPAASGSVLSSRTIEPVALRGLERAEYTVGVAGCGQRAVYIVVCTMGESDCVALRQDRPGA